MIGKKRRQNAKFLFHNRPAILRELGGILMEGRDGKTRRLLYGAISAHDAGPVASREALLRKMQRAKLLTTSEYDYHMTEKAFRFIKEK